MRSTHLDMRIYRVFFKAFPAAKTALLILADFADRLVTDDLDRTEVVKNRPDARAAFFQCPWKAGIPLAGEAPT